MSTEISACGHVVGDHHRPASLQPAGVFLSRCTLKLEELPLSQPILIAQNEPHPPFKSHGDNDSTWCSGSDHKASQDSAASSSFLAAIRSGLRDNSPSWDNNGWFIGDDSDEEEEEDDLYLSWVNPYPLDSSSAAPPCFAPAGSFARSDKRDQQHTSHDDGENCMFDMDA